MYAEFNYQCPFCFKKSIIEVEADSPSDYYMWDSCTECGAALDIEFYDSIPAKIAELYVSQQDYFEDR
jgi:hypothetical protein